MYRLFVTLGSIVVVALFAALILPWFIDWTAYKRAFEREASQVVGQPVSVGGNASLRLLPLPGFSFTELSVGRYEDGTEMMTVGEFSLTAELLPFLRGEMRIVDMRLDDPHLTVRVNENGTVDWTARQRLTIDPNNIEIEQLQIENGTLQVDGLAGGRSIRGENISASIVAQSLFGPWRISAQGSIDGVATRLQISTGRRQEDGSINLRTTAFRQASPYRYFADGPVSIEDGILQWAGDFQISPIASDQLDAPEPLPIRADGVFQATPERVTVDEYRLEIGEAADPYTVTGAVIAEIREQVQFRMTAVGRQIDLDRLQEKVGTGDDVTGLDRRLSAIQQVVDRIPIPVAQGEIRFTLPAVVAGDTVIRNVQAIVSPDGNGWRFSNLEALLPGNTQVSAQGKLGSGGDFGFTGVMELASEQPTGFAKWLSGRNNASLRQLKSAGFSAYVTITGTQATFEDLTLQIDDVKLQGRLQRIPPVNGRGAIIADLSGSEIDIDDLLAIYALTQSGSDGKAITTHDLDIQLRAGLLRGARLSARQVDAHLRVEGGSVSIDALSAENFYGAKISSSGRVTDLLGRPEGNFGLSIQAGDGSRLVELAADRLGNNRLFEAWLEDRNLVRDIDFTIRLDARPAGDRSQGQLSVSGEMAGTAIEIADRFRGRPSAWREADHEILLKFIQPLPDKLARQLSFPVMAVETQGPLSITLDVSGSGEDGFSTFVSASAADTDLTANGTIALATDRSLDPLGSLDPNLNFEFTLGSRNIDDWLLMSGYPLPVTESGAPVSLSGRMIKKAGVYTFEEIDGQYDGNGVSGELTVEARRQGGAKVSADIELESLSVVGLAEMLVGGGTLTAMKGEMPIIPFGEGDFAELDFDVELSAAAAELAPNRLVEDFGIRLVALDGSTSVPEYEFKWLGGHVSGNGSIRNVTGNVFIATQLTASEISLADALALAGFPSLSTGRAALNIGLDANGTDLAELLKTLAGNGVLSAKDVRFNGITTAGFERILEVADAEDFEIDVGAVEQLAATSMLGASFAVPEFSVPIAITAGEAAIRNLALTDENGEIRINSRYSLTTGEADASIFIAPDAGEKALPTASPEATFTWRGPPGSMELKVNSAPLESYLSLRAFEREQKRVAIMQSEVLEKQRLRREIATSLDRMAYRERQRQDDLRQLQMLQKRLQQERLTSEPPTPDDSDGNKEEDQTGEQAAPSDSVSLEDQKPSPRLLPIDDVQPVSSSGRSAPGEPIDITPTRRPASEQTQQTEIETAPQVADQDEVPSAEAAPAEAPRRRNTLMEALGRIFGQPDDRLED